MPNPLIYTVGHSTRPIDEFLRLLTAHGVKIIADALIVDGWDVRDLMTETSAPRHKRTPFLQVQNGVLTYPRENDTASLF